MDKITAALKNLLPENQLTEVSEAVASMLEDAKKELETEFNDKLEEAYAQLSKELKDAEAVAVGSYEEAYGYINDLRNRLEMQREEYEEALKKGYQEAYDELVKEREKNQNLEVGVYEEYDNKLGDMKEYIVDKIDQFLHTKGQEIYEQAKRDVISDPRMAEHKVVLDKIVDLTAGYLSDEEAVLATSAKLNEVHKSVEELKGQKKILESKIVLMNRENKQLKETVESKEKLINEVTHKKYEEEVIKEQKERSQKAKGVEGKGFNTSGKTQKVDVIAETNEVETTQEDDDVVLEGVCGVDLEQLAILSGISRTKSK